MGCRQALLLLATILVCASVVNSSVAVEVVCHRGANKVAPENTVAAAQQCIDWGVEYVEIDIRTSRDGVLYILHDATVDRTTDGKGRLRDLTSEEIDKLDAGSWFDPKFAGERIPRLEPYLRWIKGKAKVYFDVKDADIEQLIKLVYDVGMENECFFWFGRPDHAARFRQLDKKLALKVNVRTPAQAMAAATRLGANLVEVGLGNLTSELEAACRERNLRIMVIAMEDDEDAFREIIRRKADLVNLDYADVFLKVEKELSAGGRE
jgi:glycerophosphoryl diester phosphodiesterase